MDERFDEYFRPGHHRQRVLSQHARFHETIRAEPVDNE
jgi:hypothetical protein